MSATLQKGRIAIRPAAPAELPACRMLLPEAFGWGAAPCFLLAAAPDPLAFYGAAAFVAAWRRSDGRPVLKTAVRVAAPCRGRGLGTELLTRLEATARSRRIGALTAAAELPRQRGWADFLTSHGFASIQRLHVYEIDARFTADYFLRQRARLAERGKIPAAAAVVSAREAPPRRIAELLSAGLGGVEEIVAARLNARADATTDNRGFALTLDGAVQAVLLHRIDGDSAVIDSLAVAPALQGEGARAGWANVLVTARAFEHYLAAGVRRVRYVVSDANPTVIKQYLRLDPVEIQTSELFERPLEPAAAAPFHHN